jgi:hypothetical protein
VWYTGGHDGNEVTLGEIGEMTVQNCRGRLGERKDDRNTPFAGRARATVRTVASSPALAVVGRLRSLPGGSILSTEEQQVSDDE